MSKNALIKSPVIFPSVFDEFLKPWNEWLDTNNGFWGRVMTLPAVNITEKEGEYKLSLAVPGMKKSDFKIDVDGNILTVSSETEEKKEEKNERFTRTEYNYSSFNRSFTLPDEVNKEKIEAEYEDGVLKLTLPKREEAKKALLTKHVTVK